MKIMYAAMPTGDPVRSIDNDGASAARRAVKTTLKNLKRWCARLRHGTAARDFKNNQQNQSRGIKIAYDGNTTMTMIVDQEESRNRANENLENELRENLANNGQSEMYGALDDDDDCRCQPGDQWHEDEESSIMTENEESSIRDLSGVEIVAGVLRGVTRTSR